MIQPIPARCPIASLPQFLAQHHLVLVRAEWPPDGEPIAYCSPLQPALIPTDPPAPHERKAGKLAGYIAESLDWAAAHICDVQHIHLPGGLRIDLVVDSQGDTRLMLARRGVYPSDQEWCTVLAHWPYDMPLDVAPERFEHGEWRCLRAAWQTPVE